MSDIWDQFSIGAARVTSEWAWNLRQLHNGSFGSPIEEVLFAAFIFKNSLSGGSPLHQLPSEKHREVAKAKGFIDFYIVPQHPFGAYRADFLIGFYGPKNWSLKQSAIVVECDGHQWHESTKEQAQRDRQRERELNQHVAKVIRFTGSEIYQDPFACADEIDRTLEGVLLALYSE